MANLIWQQFNGISDSLWSGIKGSFYKMVGIDARSAPGSITVQQKLAKDSGSTITELCKVGLNVSDGSKLFFSATSGKIWRLASGTYTLVYTTVPGAGAAGCLGAAEYNSYVYWATQSRLHRVQVSDLAAFAAATANFATFTVTNATYHPMVVQNASLFIGDGNQVAKVDSSATFTEGGSILNIVAPLIITTMVPFDIDIIVGTIIDTSVGYCQIIRWDTVQTTWQFAEPVYEAGVNAFLWAGNNLVANCGLYGKFYVYDGQYLQPYKRLPGTWSPTATGKVNENSVANWNGITVFGFSNVSGNPCDQAVYGLGSYNKDYPPFLSEDFPLSPGTFTNLNIGVILSDGLNLYVAWNDTNGSAFGVDKLDWSNKYASAYVETLSVNADITNTTVHSRFFANYQSMPSNCSLTFKHYANHGSLATTDSGRNGTVQDTGTLQYYADEAIDARAIRVRLEFTVSNNNAPVVEAVGIQTAN